MAILLDSADPAAAAAAVELGFVNGFTTNPILMARALAGVEQADPLAHFGRLLTALPRGPAFYQPTGPSLPEVIEEARAAATLTPDRIVIKLTATAAGIRAAAVLVPEGIRCALTAVYSPAQTLLAHELGCAWAIPYVDRAQRQGIDGLGLVDEMATVLARVRSDTRVLAASLKSPAQAIAAVVHGAADITTPLDVLIQMAGHASSDAAAREFGDAALPPPPRAP